MGSPLRLTASVLPAALEQSMQATSSERKIDQMCILAVMRLQQKSPAQAEQAERLLNNATADQAWMTRGVAGVGGGGVLAGPPPRSAGPPASGLPPPPPARVPPSPPAPPP